MLIPGIQNHYLFDNFFRHVWPSICIERFADVTRSKQVSAKKKFFSQLHLDFSLSLSKLPSKCLAKLEDVVLDGSSRDARTAVECKARSPDSFFFFFYNTKAGAAVILFREENNDFGSSYSSRMIVSFRLRWRSCIRRWIRAAQAIFFKTKSMFSPTLTRMPIDAKNFAWGCELWLEYRKQRCRMNGHRIEKCQPRAQSAPAAPLPFDLMQYSFSIL